MASRINLQDEIRRITNETAAAASAKALEVAEQAKTKAAEVSSMAIAEALKAATLAATKAAEAASAAAAIAASTSKDLEYIKADIASTKLDIKSINEKLDNKYLSKEEFRITKEVVEKMERDKLNVKDSYPVIYKEGIEARVTGIEGNLSKAVWIVLGAVILAVLGVVIINK